MPAELRKYLDRAWEQAGNPPLCVAFSGGPDSSALLHALAVARREGRTLRALHVDHGLHPRSADWAAACAACCAGLDVPLHRVKVTVRTQGEGLEAAARHARYAAFADALADGEWLVTAHHRDDQAETVLLKLLRGAGPHGLGGMRERRSLGRGHLWRPLLAIPRSDLQAYLHSVHLKVIEDPANRDPDLARSYLRHELMPLLLRHWPHATQSLAHAAQLQRMQADFLDHHARLALDGLGDSYGNLQAAGWVAAHPALRARILELWLHDRGLPAPNTAQRRELERQIREAAADRVPCIAWPGTEVRVWQGFLHAMRPLPPAPQGWTTLWRGDALQLPAGTLSWTNEAKHVDPPSVRVRLNVRGLHLRPHGDRHLRALRILYQQAGVPPWRRPFCPILYDAHDTLLAVADLWNTGEGEALFTNHGMRPCWTPPG